MDYEWDETKRLSNLAKHGIDFLDSNMAFEANFKVIISLNYSKETRYADLKETVS